MSKVLLVVSWNEQKPTRSTNSNNYNTCFDQSLYIMFITFVITTNFLLTLVLFILNLILSSSMRSKKSLILLSTTGHLQTEAIPPIPNRNKKTAFVSPSCCFGKINPLNCKDPTRYWPLVSNKRPSE